MMPVLATMPTQPQQSYRQRGSIISTKVAGWNYVPRKLDYADAFFKALRAWEIAEGRLTVAVVPLPGSLSSRTGQP